MGACAHVQVIMLSYFNVRKAMDFYIAKGGSARFFICDDGFQVRSPRYASLHASAHQASTPAALTTRLSATQGSCMHGAQVVSPEDAAARSRFYESNGIPFVGRPKLGRRGVFKKASNLNYQLAISDRVSTLMAERGLTPEQALLKVRWCRILALAASRVGARGSGVWAPGGVSSQERPYVDPACCVLPCTTACHTQVWEEYDREFVAAGDLSMSDDCLILLIDADTKVRMQRWGQARTAWQGGMQTTAVQG